MASEPGIYNFTLQSRSDHTIPLIFKDSKNAAINLTGVAVAEQVWEQTRTQKYDDIADNDTERRAGSVSISLTDVQTATFTPDILRYDVLIVDGAGSKEYYLEGTIYMSEGYTTT